MRGCSVAVSKGRMAHFIREQTWTNLWMAGKTVIPLPRAILSALEMSFIIKRYILYIYAYIFTFNAGY